MKNLKLFVWYGVFTDYTSGVAFTLAETEEEARKMLIKHEELIKDDPRFGEKPQVFTKKMCYTLWGGG